METNNTWYLTKIEKILHIYWGEKTLPFLRYLTVESFIRYNPDWKIRVYIPKIRSEQKTWTSSEQKYDFAGKDYMPRLLLLKIKLIEVDFDMFGIKNTTSEVHKSDFLRWHILSNSGGLWSDMDIIYFKSINNLPFNKPLLSNIDTVVCINKEYGHSIGFMMSSKNNKFFDYIYKKAKPEFDHKNYHSVGSILFNEEFPTVDSIKKKFPRLNIFNLPMDVVYAYNSQDIEKIHKSIDMSKFTDNTIGLHWYAGHPMVAFHLNSIYQENYYRFHSVLGKVIKISQQTKTFDFLNNIIDPTDTVLDVGCGDKQFSNFLNNKQITTLDIWEPFKPDVLWDLNKLPLPFKDNSFSWTLCIDCVEHLPKNKGLQLLEELKRVCKEYVIIYTPLWWTDNHENVIDPKSPYYKNSYNAHQSLWKLEDFSEPEWKRVIKLGYLNNYYYGYWQKIKKLDKLQGTEIFVTGIYGSGKTNFARRYSLDYDLQYVDFDIRMHYDGKNEFSDEKILDDLPKNFVIDAIPFSFRETDKMFPSFSLYIKKYNPIIVCIYCSDKEEWFKRISYKNLHDNKTALFDYCWYYYKVIPILMSKTENILFYDSFKNDWTNVNQMYERMQWIEPLSKLI